MRTPVKLAAFAAVLALAFGVAVGAGTAFGGPLVPENADGHDAAAPASAHAPGGLQIAENGYRLDIAPTAPAGADVATSFRVLDADGSPVTAYDTTHDKLMHLIAVRRDTAGFQHVHPTLAADGTWSVPLELTPGQWRVFADFVPTGGEALTLGADVAVAGEFAPAPLPEAAEFAQVDGYLVRLTGRLLAGRESELTLTVHHDGVPVTDLQPYLAAYGHLVALRVGDLAYLHVHPTGAPGDGVTAPGPDVTFATTAPSPGTYRLFLDFQHEGVVRTAAFTVTTDDTAAPPAQPAPEGHVEDGHGH